MRGVSVFAAMAATAAVAVAASSQTYVQGNTRTGSGVRMSVAAGKFAIKIARFREHCRYGDRDFSEWVAFKQSSSARLGGTVNEDGSFHGLYTSSVGRFAANGVISDTTA